MTTIDTSGNTHRAPGSAAGGQFSAKANTAPQGTLAAPATSHEETIVAIAATIRKHHPDATAVIFAPHHDELNYDWTEEDGDYGDFRNAWVDVGPREREPVGYFINNDTGEYHDFDTAAKHQPGESAAGQAQMLSELRRLSAGLDRERVGFEAEGEYVIEAYLDQL